jgi:hypothetical protein
MAAVLKKSNSVQTLFSAALAKGVAPARVVLKLLFLAMLQVSGPLRRATRIVGLLFALQAGTVPAAAEPGAVSSSSNPSSHHSHYQFALTRGSGVEVCEANLRRLRATIFESPPDCGFPESEQIKGFSRLNRVPLTREQIRSLHVPIYAFTRFGHQTPKDRAEFPLGIESQGDPSGYEEYWKAWKYVPPLSIENNKRTEDIVVWQDPAAALDGYRCGEVVRQGPAQTLIRVEREQLAYVIRGDGKTIDETRTRELFGNRWGGKFVMGDASSVVLDPGFAPLANDLGFFEYNGLIYMEGFFSPTYGDFEGKRRSDESLRSALGVFLREKGRTRQVCEYQVAEQHTRKNSRD